MRLLARWPSARSSQYTPVSGDFLPRLTSRAKRASFTIFHTARVVVVVVVVVVVHRVRQSGTPKRLLRTAVGHQTAKSASHFVAAFCDT